MTVNSFREKIEKLNEFWGSLEISQDLSISSDKILRKVIRFLPESLSCPEITSTRIVFHDKVFSQGKTKDRTKELVSPIHYSEDEVGQIEFIYCENGTKIQGAGLEEDEIILNLLSERIGDSFHPGR